MSSSVTASLIDGTLILPSSADYAAAKGIFNSRFNPSTPAAVLAAASVADVQKALAFASSNHIGVSARSDAVMSAAIRQPGLT